MNSKNNFESSNEYKVCSNCVMDTTVPGIEFDENGICQRCNKFYKYILPNWNKGYGKENELKSLLNKIKASGKGKPYDCILGLSGGLDSSYMLHLAVKEFGLRVLVVHVDSGWDMPFAKRNIEKLVNKLGTELVIEKINEESFRKFQLAMFKSGVKDLDIPQDMAFVSIIDEYARKYKIKYILNGGNISTEVASDPSAWVYWGTDMRYIKDLLKKYDSWPLENYPFTNTFKRKIIIPYLYHIKTIKLLNYVPYIVKEAEKLLMMEYGWESYEQKHFESIMTKFLQGYWLPKRFGVDFRRPQFSSLILTEQLTRNEALEKLKTPIIPEDEAKELFKLVAEKLNIKESELKSYMELPKKSYKDFKNMKKIIDIGSRALFILGIDKLIRE